MFDLDGGFFNGFFFPRIIKGSLASVFLDRLSPVSFRPVRRHIGATGRREIPHVASVVLKAALTFFVIGRCKNN